MGWRQSLIRISNFKVEELQKRLKEIEDRREAALLVLDALDRLLAADPLIDLLAQQGDDQ